MPEAAEAGSLDLAIDWLQRNLDDLTAATRRTQALATGGPLVTPATTPAAARRCHRRGADRDVHCRLRQRRRRRCSTRSGAT